MLKQVCNVAASKVCYKLRKINVTLPLLTVLRWEMYVYISTILAIEDVAIYIYVAVVGKK